MKKEVIGKTDAEGGDSGRHWFVQESGENARQLLIYADRMDLTDDKALKFYNADGSLFMEFPPGWWTNVEFGQD